MWQNVFNLNILHWFLFYIWVNEHYIAISYFNLQQYQMRQLETNKDIQFSASLHIGTTFGGNILLWTIILKI